MADFHTCDDLSSTVLRQTFDLRGGEEIISAILLSLFDSIAMCKRLSPVAPPPPPALAEADVHHAVAREVVADMDSS